jgi:hypothetical protein
VTADEDEAAVSGDAVEDLIVEGRRESNGQLGLSNRCGKEE